MVMLRENSSKGDFILSNEEIELVIRTCVRSSICTFFSHIPCSFVSSFSYVFLSFYCVFFYVFLFYILYPVYDSIIIG